MTVDERRVLEPSTGELLAAGVIPAAVRVASTRAYSSAIDELRDEIVDEAIAAMRPALEQLCHDIIDASIKPDAPPVQGMLASDLIASVQARIDECGDHAFPIAANLSYEGALRPAQQNTRTQVLHANVRRG